MTSSEDAAEELRQALESGEHVESVLKRITATIAWTMFLERSAAGTALIAAIKAAPASQAQEAAVAAYFDRSTEAEIKDTEERWWSYPPVAADADDVLHLTFVDVTPGDECWEPERVLCSAGEPFARAAQRFRVTVNKKHRHPFLPSLYYDVILGEGAGAGKRATFKSLAGRTVDDVLRELGTEHTLRYIRDDDGPDQREDTQWSPSRLFSPWDRARIMPSWCTTPDSWFEPTPPPGFSAPEVQGKQFYIAVPTLFVPCKGIVPSAVKPQLIARTLYWPVEHMGTDIIVDYLLDREKDYVPLSQRVVPSTLTVEAARALLGRYIQSSSVADQEPQRDDNPPSHKKRKKAPAINKYATRTVAIAWGLTLDNNGQPDWLHCFVPALRWQSDRVFDLKCLGRKYRYSPVLATHSAWIGAVVLDADKRALKEDKQQVSRNEHDSFDEWVKKTQRWIQHLNTEGADKLVEVDRDGTFVAGDIEQSKADWDEWEASISGAKPGLWRMFIFASQAAYFVWVREGTLDYDALPQISSNNDGETEEEDGEWEELGSFSVDSGMVGFFSESALDTLIGDGKKQEKMETLIDAMTLEGQGEFMPGGIILSGDDGGYTVQGMKDEEGKVIKLRMIYAYIPLLGTVRACVNILTSAAQLQTCSKSCSGHVGTPDSARHVPRPTHRSGRVLDVVVPMLSDGDKNDYAALNTPPDDSDSEEDGNDNAGSTVPTSILGEIRRKSEMFYFVLHDDDLIRRDQNALRLHYSGDFLCRLRPILRYLVVSVPQTQGRHDDPLSRL
ncbi:hypothetical protein EXIGLDRAFT_692258 [Exidia glandulosa HHB12029]|uniref:Uncharacterized protein n=1 Tax=Exidia glandulosa HHB12029 TaxID=1314781 RepID=A0A165NZX7_EXIGL|nr:hypothetical protein EXIGLDRAFT_692258 [Exidia glandulosa HHB12029]